MVSTFEEHQLTCGINDHSRARDLQQSIKDHGRLNRPMEEMLKEKHMEELRRADVTLPGAFPGRQTG